VIALREIDSIFLIFCLSKFIDSGASLTAMSALRQEMIAAAQGVKGVRGLPKIRTLWGALALALAITACHRMEAVYEVRNHPIPKVAREKLNDEKIGEAIVQASLAKSWRPDEDRSGHIRARTQWKEHIATVDIFYTNRDYSILLASSENLKENEGEIHREYNRRVRALEDAIEAELYRDAY